MTLPLSSPAYQLPFTAEASAKHSFKRQLHIVNVVAVAATVLCDQCYQMANLDIYVVILVSQLIKEIHSSIRIAKTVLYGRSHRYHIHNVELGLKGVLCTRLGSKGQMIR